MEKSKGGLSCVLGDIIGFFACISYRNGSVTEPYCMHSCSWLDKGRALDCHSEVVNKENQSHTTHPSISVLYFLLDLSLIPVLVISCTHHEQ